MLYYRFLEKEEKSDFGKENVQEGGPVSDWNKARCP